MTRKDYVIVSTTGTILFLVSIPWFLLVKNHLMLEPPYFRVDPSFVQSEEGRQRSLSERRLSVSAAVKDAVVVKRPVGRVQLVNLPTPRVGALADVEPPSSKASEGQQMPAKPIETAKPPPAPAPTLSLPVAPSQVLSSPQPRDDQSTPQSTVRQAGPELYGIQVAAFKRKASAKKLARTYEETGTEVHIVTRDLHGKRWYRVVLGGYRDRQEAVQFGEAFQAVRGAMQTQLVSFQPSSQSGNGDPR